MDDFGTIIYILLTIVAIVFSFMKKANADKTKGMPPADSNDPFDEVIPSFTKMFEIQKEDEDVEESVEEIVQTGKPGTFIQSKTQANPVVNSFQERMRRMESNMKRVEKVKTSLEVEDLEEEKKSWFNAREAIIYSEILKRPEF
jgi:hypothetical protein